jgi:hypothetical protein
MSNGFELFNSIGNYVNIAADFLFGKKEYESGDVTGRGGGAIGFLADTFLETTKGSASERRQEEAIRMDIPQLGTGARARVQGVAQGRPFVGSNNAALQAAIRRGFAGGGRNPQYTNLWRQYAAQRTTGSGRRTVGLESPKVAGATPIKAASVRVMKDTV